MNILVSAYACNPTSSLQLHPGEDITGWRQVGQIRRFHKVWVITHSYNRDGVEQARAAGEYPDVVFRFLDLGPILGLLYKAEIGQRIYYYLWQLKAWLVARRLHRRIGFDLAHHLTFGNDWIGSFIGAFLPVPYIHGPVGGGQAEHPRLRREGDDRGLALVRHPPRTNRHLRQRRNALVRAAGAGAGVLRTRPSEEPRGASPRMDVGRALRLLAQGGSAGHARP